jgi:hypothetical protein
MKSWLVVLLALGSAVMAQATIALTPWRPVYKGVEHAVGTNYGTTTLVNNGVTYTISRLQSVNCIRVDLNDPDVRLFTTPRAPNYVVDSSETLSMTVSNFLEVYGLQVATVANFYNTQGTPDPIAEGLPTRVYGLHISTGQLVSATDFGPDSNNRHASLLFTTNNQPLLALRNSPPGTNTSGIYTAVSGYFAVLTNGVVISKAALAAAYPDDTFHQTHPRTVLGISADRRYFYMVLIDGRQPGYSDGADPGEMGLWMWYIGASDAIAMDGGGSASMYYEDCLGVARPYGRSSYIGRGRERITGSHIGVYAPPLPQFVNDISVVTTPNTATVTWRTDANATSQVEYGVTRGYGNLSALSTAQVTNHSVVISNLMPSTRYYFRVLSAANGTVYTSPCDQDSFVTTNFGGGVVIPMTAAWKWSTNNLDNQSWPAPAYDDSAWPSGVAPLWADNRATFTNFAIPNVTSGTRLPISGGYPHPTYYFRRAFVFTNDPAGVSLIFSNYLDDGAVFYLNGVEVYRTNMIAAPTAVGYFSNALSFTYSDATIPIVFTLTGGAATNLVRGTNVLAVTVHNYRNPAGGNPSPDSTFEMALLYELPPPPPFVTNIVMEPGESSITVAWRTRAPARVRVEYGTTPALGSSTPLTVTEETNHVLVVGGLEPKTLYHLRLIAISDDGEFGELVTAETRSFYAPLVFLTQDWNYTSEDQSTFDWTSSDFELDGWGEGSALFYIEDNVGVSPRLTPLPNDEPVSPTYYFRTRFNLNQPPAGYTLVFTNYVDDGAIFYLNGVEIYRLRMPPGPVTHLTPASSCPINFCEATADVPDVFRLSGSALQSLVQGNNLLAVEVHQFHANDDDIVFGSEVGLVRATAAETALNIVREGDRICITWPSEFLTLQQSASPSTAGWTDVPGPVKNSPYCLTNPPSSLFFRLRD